MSNLREIAGRLRVPHGKGEGVSAGKWPILPCLDYVRNVPVRPRRHARLTQWVPSAAKQRCLLGTLSSRRRTVSRAPDDGISVLGSRHMLPKTRRPAYVAHCHGLSSSNSLPARPSPPRPQALRAMLRAIRRPSRRVRSRAGRSATQPLGACHLPVDETGVNSNSTARPTPRPMTGYRQTPTGAGTPSPATATSHTAPPSRATAKTQGVGASHGGGIRRHAPARAGTHRSRGRAQGRLRLPFWQRSTWSGTLFNRCVAQF